MRRVVLCLLLAAASHAHANLLVNGSFTTNVAGWQTPTSSFPLAWSSFDAGDSTSSGSAQIAVVQQQQAGATSNFFQAVTLSSNAHYVASVKGILPLGQQYTGTIQLVVRMYNAQGQQLASASSNVISNPRNWTTLATDFTPPAGTTQGRFWLYAYRNEAFGELFAFFDDAILDTIKPPGITIDGPTQGQTNQRLTFEAIVTGCNAAPNSWTWTATGKTELSGQSTRTVTAVFPSAGQYTLAVANASCTNLSATRTIAIETAPARVLVGAFPPPLIQDENAGGATTRYTLINEGDASTTIALRQNGDFFTQSPTQFTLGARASQTITITGLARGRQAARGTSIPSGTGVPANLEIPITLLSVARPTAPVSIRPAARRVDIAAATGTKESDGSVVFLNAGAATMNGALISTAPWLIPQTGLISIPPNQSASVAFKIDRSRRPDDESPLGSVRAELQLAFRTPASSATGNITTHDTSGSTTSLVTIVDTTTPVTSTTSLPALSPGEVALIIPGVGHIQGTVGLFISDVSITNTSPLASIGDLKLFYTPLGNAITSQLSSLPSISPAKPLSFADLVKTVFKNESQIGSLQLRSVDISKVSVSTNVFNSSNPAGTYGTALPVLRSDRGVAPGAKMYLTGLRRSSTSHTNLYLQETAGLGATVTIEFVESNGAVFGARTETLGAFASTQIGNAVPDGAVAAILTSSASSPGRFLAFATPVDDASGDTWVVSDWRQQDGYSGSETMTIPVAGALHGANSTYFRTDLAIMNTGSSTSGATLRYYNRNGTTIDRVLTLGALESRILDDVITTLFGVTTDSAGFLVFTPSSGTFAVTSRTYTTVINDVATFGTGVPTRSQIASLKAGDVRRIGGVDDASLESINAGRGGTFRTNFALVETSGQPATVRVTVHYTTTTALTTGTTSASRDFNLAANQFLLMGGISREILGPGRDELGDLHNLQVDFAHVGGAGTVEVFLSSVDNGTGDSILRVD